MDLNLIKNINENINELENLLEKIDDLLIFYNEWKQQHKNSLHEVLAQTPEEGIDWDPESVKEFKGKGGITRSAGYSAREKGISPRDIVISAKDNKINKIGVVLNVKRGLAKIGTPGNPELWKEPISIKALKLADSQHPAIRKIKDRNPNRNVWVLNAGKHWALPQT